MGNFEKIDIKGMVFRAYYEDGDEIKIMASWAVGNKKEVNFHWLDYGDGTVEKQIYRITKKDGKDLTNEEIYEQADEIIEQIKDGSIWRNTQIIKQNGKVRY